MDPNENLVTIHYHPDMHMGEATELAGTHRDILPNDQIHWTQCPTDRGRGALSVTSASGLQIVNIHVPFKEEAALSLLTEISWPNSDRPFVLVGDMNREAADLMKMIDQVNSDKPTSGVLSSITTSKRTRTGLDKDGRRHDSWIDYLVISSSLKSAFNTSIVVHDEVGEISDHYPILLHLHGE